MLITFNSSPAYLPEEQEANRIHYQEQTLVFIVRFVKRMKF